MTDLCPCCRQPLPIYFVEWNNDIKQLLADGKTVYFGRKQAFIVNLLWNDRKNPAGLSSKAIGERYETGEDGGSLTVTKTINVRIWEIKRKLREAGIHSVTIPKPCGIGYRLVITPNKQAKVA